uniref:NAD(P)(+)--arginine ADP-ribosyltransferase 1 n=1 Tax=Gallus gallus TaxID=9031 RepID=NRT1_CHICK|nr:RecName: Full=NAD(P)(+)--arginine ADP-ribosyltransferase 1; AltName: Full=Mono(ADP-ribosyl)transferase 1; Short=AT1; Flags: Precursor [Gallus gallus]BAA06664.1 ADP-ribosyltransferase [Gallus gallus]
MELLALRWVLLAGTLLSTSAASSALQEGDLGSITVIMDMALNSFDDQYLLCEDRMRARLQMENITEFSTNIAYAVTWRQAAAEWQKRWGHLARPMQLIREQAIALLAYSASSRMCTLFNEATRQGGRSHQDYIHSYHFKTLHFFLTQALFALRASQPRCYYVYRGVRGIRFMTQRGKSVRFGQFTSTSLRKEATVNFGQDTLFVVKTCYGVPIKQFSFFPSEDEVLIPPFEVFEVINFSNDRGSVKIQLHSKGKMSTHNCELLKPQGGQWGRGHQEVGLGLSPGLSLPVLPCRRRVWEGLGHREGDPIPAAV